MNDNLKAEITKNLFRLSKKEFDTIISVDNYSLSDFVNLFNGIIEPERLKLLESLINKELVKLKKIATPNDIGEAIINSKTLTNHYSLGDYDSTKVLDDILLKLAGCHKNIDIPINIEVIQKSYFSHRKNDNTIYQSFVWILLNIMAITYYIENNII